MGKSKVNSFWYSLTKNNICRFRKQLCTLCVLCTKNTVRSDGIMMISYPCGALIQSIDFCFDLFVWSFYDCIIYPWLKYHYSSVKLPHTWKSLVSRDKTWAYLGMSSIVNSSCSLDTLPLNMGLLWRTICQRNHLSNHSQLTLNTGEQESKLSGSKMVFSVGIFEYLYQCVWPMLT